MGRGIMLHPLRVGPALFLAATLAAIEVLISQKSPCPLNNTLYDQVTIQVHVSFKYKKFLPAKIIMEWSH